MVTLLIPEITGFRQEFLLAGKVHFEVLGFQSMGVVDVAGDLLLARISIANENDGLDKTIVGAMPRFERSSLPSSCQFDWLLPCRLVRVTVAP